MYHEKSIANVPNQNAFSARFEKIGRRGIDGQPFFQIRIICQNFINVLAERTSFLGTEAVHTLS